MINRVLLFLALGLALSFSACQQETSGAAQATVLDCHTFWEQYQAEEQAQLLDVRTAGELAAGALPDCQHIDIYEPDFAEQLQKLDKEKPVYVYCKSGARSAKAATQLRSAGFSKVYDMQGGYDSWKSKCQS